MIVAMGNISPDANTSPDATGPEYVQVGYNVESAIWSSVDSKWIVTLAGMNLMSDRHVVVVTSIAYSTYCYWYFSTDGKLEVHCRTEDGTPVFTPFSFVVFEVA